MDLYSGLVYAIPAPGVLVRSLVDGDEQRGSSGDLLKSLVINDESKDFPVVS